MWYGWDTDGFVIHISDNCEQFISFKTKKDLIQEATFMYSDGRKKPTVKRIGTGYYEYTPRDCDGYWREPILIIEEKAIDMYGYRETFKELLKEFNKIESFEGVL